MSAPTHATKAGLFYGSSTCYTEIAAEKIRDYFHQSGNAEIELHNLAEEDIAAAATYRYLILGIPTWDYGELQEDWERQWSQLGELDLRGKTIALYGLGDQIGYPDWFQDAMGYLHQLVTHLGAKTVGTWSAAGYEFNQSQALTPDATKFVGLALDDENEFELSDQRIATWCQQLIDEFGW